MMDLTHAIKVVGVGGSGCAAVERMMGCQGCELIAVHTDANSLLSRKVPTKILIGKTITKGRSTGNNMALGKAAALADMDQIKSSLEDAKITFVIAGLGGGTGAGAAPVVAEAAKSAGSTVIAFVNTPFTAEGKVCKANAQAGMDGLKPYCDLIVIIRNDDFLKMVPNMSIRDAFTKVNNMLLEAVRGMVKLITDSGLENLKPMLSGQATIGYGAGFNMSKAVDAALESHLVGANIREAAGALIVFTTHSAELKGLQEALDSIPKKTNPSISIIWTNDVEDTAEGVEAIIIFTGVKPQI